MKISKIKQNLVIISDAKIHQRWKKEKNSQ